MLFESLQSESPQENKIQIYQLFPRLFSNSEKGDSLFGSIQENGCGKFEDIDDKVLFELKCMGFTHIWLTGVLDHATCSSYRSIEKPPVDPFIVKGRAGSPYAVRDYYDVCPDLAERPVNRKQEFKSLIERVLENGQKVLIDFVPNHVARSYKSTNLPKGKTDLGAGDDVSKSFSPQNNFYYLPNSIFSPPENYKPLDGKLSEVDYEPFFEVPSKATGNGVFNPKPSKDDWFETIKLNYGVDYEQGGKEHFDPIPKTWQDMKDILLYWLDFGVDGFRCDMVELVPLSFWGWVIPQVKEKFPEAILIGEVYELEKHRQFIEEGKFDFIYDKSGLYDTLVEILKKGGTTDSIPQVWKNFEGINSKMLRFMENHDEVRIGSKQFLGEPSLAFGAMATSALLNSGPIMIYNGQESGEKGDDVQGFSKEDGKTSIFDYTAMPQHQQWWNEGKINGHLRDGNLFKIKEFYRRLLNVCKSHPSIKAGKLFDLHYYNNNLQSHQYHGEKHYSFLRIHEGECILVIANFDDRPWEGICVKIPEKAWELTGFPIEGGYLCKDLLTSGQVVSFSPRDLFGTEQKDGLTLNLAAGGAFAGKIFHYRNA